MVYIKEVAHWATEAMAQNVRARERGDRAHPLKVIQAI